MIREDHPSNVKQGSVCIFYKETLCVRVVTLSSLSECIIFEVSIQNNKDYIGVVYRSPSQDTIEFQNFLSNFETILSDATTNNALFTIILGDFNASSSVWWTNDKTGRHETRIPCNCAWVSSTHITTHSSNVTIFFLY